MILLSINLIFPNFFAQVLALPNAGNVSAHRPWLPAHLAGARKPQVEFDRGGHHRVPVHTEWRLPISGVYLSSWETSALTGEGGGCTPTPFLAYCITITYKVAVYAPAVN